MNKIIIRKNIFKIITNNRTKRPKNISLRVGKQNAIRKEMYI